MFMRYLPFLNGKYSTGPGLILMEKAVHPEDEKIFQIDDCYDETLLISKSAGMKTFINTTAKKFYGIKLQPL